MAQPSRKRATTSTVQPSSKRARDQEGAGDEHSERRSAQRQLDPHDEGFEEANERDGEDFSTQAISELETDITTLIRNTGKNDSWPAAFKEQVLEREKELLRKIATGMSEREKAEECFHTSFLPFLAGCLARVGVRPLDPKRPFPILDPSPRDQPLFEKSSTLIRESQNLLEDYNALVNVQSDTSSRERLLATLAREEDAIGRAIRAGKRVAHAEIDSLLGFAVDKSVVAADSQRGSDVLRVGAQEAEEKARARGEVVDGARKRERWAVVAAEMVRAFGKMSKVAEAEADDDIDAGGMMG